jgi:hypothetical protein
MDVVGWVVAVGQASGVVRVLAGAGHRLD